MTLPSLRVGGSVAALLLAAQLIITPGGNVRTDQSNTYTTGAQDMSAATSHTVPVGAGYAPTANGSLGFNSTQNCWSLGGATLNGCGPRTLYATQSTTDTLTAATINTTETQFASTWQIPANYLIANKILRVTYTLQWTATATVPTSTARLRLGAVGIGGTVIYLGNTTTNSTFTNVSCTQSFLIVGTAAAGASVNVTTTATAIASGLATFTKQNTAQPVAIATNAAQNINLTWQYSTNAATNSTTVLAMLVEELN